MSFPRPSNSRDTFSNENFQSGKLPYAATRCHRARRVRNQSKQLITGLSCGSPRHRLARATQREGNAIVIAALLQKVQIKADHGPADNHIWIGCFKPFEKPFYKAPLCCTKLKIRLLWCRDWVTDHKDFFDALAISVLAANTHRNRIKNVLRVRGFDIQRGHR